PPNALADCGRTLARRRPARVRGVRLLAAGLEVQPAHAEAAGPAAGHDRIGALAAPGDRAAPPPGRRTADLPALLQSRLSMFALQRRSRAGARPRPPGHGCVRG